MEQMEETFMLLALLKRIYQLHVLIMQLSYQM